MMNGNTDEEKNKISEIDVPPTENDINYQSHSKILEKSISEAETKELERKAAYADRMERHIYKKHGLDLMIGCLIAYGLIVVFDTFTSKMGVKISEFASSFVELLKFMVSTLVGFVFSDNLKNKDK